MSQGLLHPRRQICFTHLRLLHLSLPMDGATCAMDAAQSKSFLQNLKALEAELREADPVSTLETWRNWPKHLCL